MLPAHVQRERERQALANGEVLAEKAPTSISGYDEAIRLVSNQNEDVRRLHDEASHIRKCLAQGTIGQSPMSADHRRVAVEAGLRLAAHEHWMARAAGAKLLQAADAANLATAVAVDKAERLDAGTATENITLGAMRMPGVRTLEGVTYRTPTGETKPPAPPGNQIAGDPQ